MSAAIASWAARLISAGAGKSGKPCDKLIAPYCSARRVISRITDSVKRSAFSESLRLTLCAGAGLAGFILGSVQLAIDLGVSHHDLNVLPRLRERYRIHERRKLRVVLPRCPERQPILARIVRGQGRFCAAKLLSQLGKIE